MLKITTLGEFKILLDGVSIFERSEPKRGLLLVYLLEKGRPQNRLDVARLLWTNIDDTTALANLRSLLLRMRRDGLDPYLQGDRFTVFINPSAHIDYDVSLWRALSADLQHAQFDDLLTAADLYQDDFLAITELDDYPLLEEWASATRIELERQAEQVIGILVRRALETNQCQLVVHHASKLAALMPYTDEAQLLYMRVLINSGQVSQALQHFHSYRRRLKTEMDITEISSELLAQVEQLSSPSRAINLAISTATLDQFATHTDTVKHSTVPSLPVAKLPHLSTPVVDRVAEAALLATQLNEQARLISVVGLGGVGKSIFLRSQIATLHDRFGEGLRFVDLSEKCPIAADPGDHLLYSIAAAQACIPQSDLTMLDQVINSLKGNVRGLLLDNFEATPATSAIVQAFLQRLPRLTVIVTSRKRLNLRGEHVLALHGLPIEVDLTNKPEATESDAVGLFIEHVNHVRPDFVADKATRDLVEFICRRVDGLPLGLVLAAQQVSFYDLNEIVRELHNSNNLLQSQYVDTADAHHSIDAILSSAWQNLNQDERKVLVAAYCFSAEFPRDAIHALVAAPLSAYTTLTDASLLRVTETGWYTLSPMLRTYLAGHPEAMALHQPLRQRHTAYMLAQFHLNEYLLDPVTLTKPKVFDRLQRQRQDLFAAWRRAVEGQNWELLQNAVVSLGHFVLATELYTEGIALLQLLLDRLPPVALTTSSQQRLIGQASFFIGFIRTKEDPNLGAEVWNAEGIRWLERAGTAYEGDIVRRYAGSALPAAAQVLSTVARHTLQPNQPAYV